jgi:Cu(I)/Ag(I) efflux system membrane protein CusA/SilA
MTTTVEGRERYAIRIRYPRELRSDPDILKRIYLPTENGQQIPLGDLVDVRYEQGAQSIKSEDGFLIGYVLFDKKKGYSEVEVVNNAQTYLQEKITDGTLKIPSGVSYRFAGNYEQQVRANKRLSIVLPIALAIIFLILYFHFGSVTISAMVFTGVFIAFAGGFIMIGLYDTSWFLNFDFFGTNMRDLFQIRTINLSVAVWVGFLALFGIATDDGVLVATFLRDSFKRNKPKTIESVRDAVVEGGLRRVRPAMMTTATTILALLPVLTSTGRGADIMLPMAIPSFGGMTLQIITMFTVPVLFSLWQEWKLRIDNQFDGKSMSRKSAIVFILMLGVGLNSSYSQSLESLVDEVLENNLELRILENEYYAALQKAPQVSQLQDPEVGIGLFPLPVETRLGAQILRIGATQMFPWRGTLDSKEEMERIRASVLYERVGARSLELVFQVEQLYFQLYEIEQSQSILSRNLDILESLDQLVLTKVAIGSTTAADVLRLQLKIEETNQELKILEAAKAKPISSLNQLLNRPLEMPIVTTDILSFAIIPFDKSILSKNIEADHPMLRMYELQQEVSQQAIVLNELNGKPSFGVGLDYILVDSRSDANPQFNGRDIVQVRGTIKVPLYRKKYEAKEIEEKLRIAVIKDKRTNILSLFMADIERAHTDYETARLKMSLYEKQIEITRAAINILESNYSTKGKEFDELLRYEMELIDYDLKKLKAVVQSHVAKSSIERYIIE